MEEKQIQKLDQYEELQFEKYIDWSVISYEDDVSSEEEGPAESVAKWIINRKRKRPSQEQPD